MIMTCLSSKGTNINRIRDLFTDLTEARLFYSNTYQQNCIVYSNTVNGGLRTDLFIHIIYSVSISCNTFLDIFNNSIGLENSRNDYSKTIVTIYVVLMFSIKKN